MPPFPAPRPPDDDAFASLGAEVTGCRACQRLVAWREQAATDRRGGHLGESYWARPLPGFGDRRARIVLVGLAPAAHGGNRTGRMFTGDRSGDFLFAALHRAGLANQPTSTALDDGLALTGVYVTAPVRCAPPDNRPTIEERDRCAPFLAREVTLLTRARLFLALGAYGYEALWRLPGLAAGRRPKFGHGVEAELTPSPEGEPRTLLCSYHPSQRNVFTGLLTPEMFDGVLARACGLVGLAGPA
ncbi:MAG TPA: uracil-DNA glycosylase [Acidimicrobiales bacterium]|nr:uracil-DNA glycosylase [Acidimicrobiales bacterium]